MAQQSGSPVTTPESTKPAATHPVSKPDLAVAQELEKSGKVPEAFAEFRKWLDSNPDDPRYVKTLLHAAEIAPTIGQGLDLLKSGLTNVKNSDERSSLYAAMAATAELSGDIEHAQQYYELAYLEAPSGISRYEDLLRSAQLLFELGRLEESGSRVDLILSAVPAPQDSHEGGALRIAARLLAARIQRDKNGPLAGYEAARSLIDSSNAGPDVYLFVVESAFEAGKHAEAQAAFEALKKKYGQSPEVSLAASTLGARGANGRVGYMPSPSRVLAPVTANAAEKSAQTAAGGQVANTPANAPIREAGKPVTSIAVQTGSFTKRNNADSLAANLTGKGFKPVIRPVEQNGTTYYRVIVPVTAEPGTSPSEAAQRALLRLKQDGFEGYLVPN